MTLLINTGNVTKIGATRTTVQVVDAVMKLELSDRFLYQSSRGTDQSLCRRNALRNTVTLVSPALDM